MKNTVALPVLFWWILLYLHNGPVYPLSSTLQARGVVRTVAGSIKRPELVFGSGPNDSITTTSPGHPLGFGVYLYCCLFLASSLECRSLEPSARLQPYFPQVYLCLNFVTVISYPDVLLEYPHVLAVQKWRPDYYKHKDSLWKLV